MIKVIVWPDGTWCDEEDLHEYTHMSDDYEIVYLTDLQYEKLLETNVIQH